MNGPESTSHKRENEFVVVGRLGAAHGVRGWLKVTSYTEPRSNLLDYAPWYLKNETQWQRRDVLSAKAQGKALIVHLDGIHDRDQALTLRGIEVAIRRDQLPSLDDDEYYWADLIGLEVVTTTNVSLGRITEMMATGANDVMVVDDDERRRLVPFAQPQYVKSVDRENGRLTVDWDPEF